MEDSTEEKNLEFKLVVDIQSILSFLTTYGIGLEEYIKIVELGFIIWDSHGSPYPPFVIDDKFNKVMLIDRSKLNEEEREELDIAIKEGKYDILKGLRKE